MPFFLLRLRRSRWSMRQRGERHIESMAGVSERGVDHIETMDGPEILNSVDQIEKLDKVARRTFGLNVAEHSRHRRRDTRRRAVRASVARSNLVLQTIIASNE